MERDKDRINRTAGCVLTEPLTPEIFFAWMSTKRKRQEERKRYTECSNKLKGAELERYAVKVKRVPVKTLSGRRRAKHSLVDCGLMSCHKVTMYTSDAAA